jgi:hypothetical protein
MEKQRISNHITKQKQGGKTMKTQKLFTAMVAALLAIVAVVALFQGMSVSPVYADSPPGETCEVIQPDRNAGQDAFIKQDRPDEKKGGDKELRVKTENGKLNRSLLQFDLSSLPPDVIINSATLSLYVKEVKDGSVTINAHELTDSWTEAEVTWKARDKAASSLWVTPGGDYNSTVVASKYLAKDTKNVWADWDITSLVADWVSNPSTNYGLILESPVTSPKSEAKFKSSDDGTASQRPKLEVCYSTGVILDPDHDGEGVAGHTRTYAHTVHVGNITDTINLSASSDQGWIVRIYKDENGDGVKDEDTPITQTPSIGPNEDYHILVEVDVPAGTSGTIDVTTVTATGDSSGVSDTATDRTTVSDKFLTVQPDNEQQVSPGDEAFYGHSVTNNGDSQDCVTVTVASSQGWSVQLWEDSNGDGVKDGGEPDLSNPVCINPGATYDLGAKINVPSGATDGTEDQTVVTVTSGNYPGESDSATDTTQVSIPPVVDGLLDSSYSFLKHFSKGPEDGHSTLAPGNLYGYEGADTCYWAFVVDRAFNDNVYADKGLDDPYMLLDGWTVEHSFGKLKGSDKAIFDVIYAGGSYTHTVTLDYLNDDGDNWTSGQTGADGSEDPGTPPIDEAATSLHWNLENSGWDGGTWGDPLKHSPPYTTTLPWEWHMIYEFSIPKSEMGGQCGEVSEAGAHNSPNKDDESLGKIGDYVWWDVDVDGVQDGDETGIGGVTVNLYDSTDTKIRTTQTAPSGYYIFNNLNAGDYYVKFVLPSDDYSFSLQDQGSNDAVDSDADPTTGKTGIINLSAGETDLTWDAGLHLCDIGDRVWHDESGGGDQNNSIFPPYDPEPGFNDVDVYLYDYQPSTCGEDGYLAMTTTISGTSQTPDDWPNGIYGFDMTLHGTGDYWVCVDESTLPSAGEGMHWKRTSGIHTTGDNPQKVTYTGSDDFSIDFGYEKEADPTAVTLSTFAAKPGAGSSVSPLWLGVAGLTGLVAGSLFWVKRRAG